MSLPECLECSCSFYCYVLIANKEAPNQWKKKWHSKKSTISLHLLKIHPPMLPPSLLAAVSQEPGGDGVSANQFIAPSWNQRSCFLLQTSCGTLWFYIKHPYRFKVNLFWWCCLFSKLDLPCSTGPSWEMLPTDQGKIERWHRRLLFSAMNFQKANI